MAAVVTIHMSYSAKQLTAETTSDRLKWQFKNILKIYSSLAESSLSTFALPPIIPSIMCQIPTPRKPPFFQEQIHDLNLIPIQGGSSNAESQLHQTYWICNFRKNISQACQNHYWRKLENLWKYCEETGFDPFAARDSLEERLGVKLECDCQIINNDSENRSKALANAFGADLGEPGRDFDFF